MLKKCKISTYIGNDPKKKKKGLDLRKRSKSKRTKCHIIKRASGAAENSKNNYYTQWKMFYEVNEQIIVNQNWCKGRESIIQKLTAATPPPRITYLKLFSAMADWSIRAKEAFSWWTFFCFYLFLFWFVRERRRWGVSCAAGQIFIGRLFSSLGWPESF